MKYRAAMEDEEIPGTLGRRVDYDRRRQPEMASGSSLNHMLKLTWIEIGKLFDLYETFATKDTEKEPSYYQDGDIGLRVLDDGREVIHGDKVYVYYLVR